MRKIIILLVFCFISICYVDSTTLEQRVEQIINGTYFNANNPQKQKVSVRRPYKNGKIDYEFERKILLTEVRVDDYIHKNGDVNGDDKINCIDHAIMFKLLWDKHFTSLRDRCFIIRNHSKTMNHLFIGLYDDDKNLMHIETWMIIGTMQYSLEDYYGKEKYDPLYNHYNETDMWLEEFYTKKPIFGMNKKNSSK